MPAEPDEELLRAAYNYAWRRLGYAIWPINRGMFSDEDVEAWDRAVNEYLSGHCQQEGNGTG